MAAPREPAEQTPADQRFLQTVVDALPALVFVKDREHRFLLVNRAWEEMTGVARDRAVGMTARDLFSAEVADAMHRLDQAAIDTGGRTEGEQVVPSSSGPKTYLSSRYPIRAASTEIEGVVCLAVDITDRKRAEDRLQEYARVVDGLEEMIVVVDREYRYRLANRAFLNYRGLTSDALLGTSVPDVMDRGLFEREVKDKLDQALAGSSVRYEISDHHPKRGPRDLAVSYYPIEGPAGVDRVACVLHDVTDRKRASADLQKANAFAETVIETANILFLQLDPAGRVQKVNAAAEEITGYTRAEVEGTNWFETLVPRERFPHAWREFARLMSEGVIAGSFENPILTKAGDERQVMWRNTTLREGDRITGIVSFGMDVTDQRKAGEEQARLSRVVEQTTESIIITDPAGTIIYVNPAFESLSGYTRAEVMGGNPRLLKSGHQDATFYGRMWDTLARGEVWKGRLVNRRKDGTLFQEDAIIGPVRDSAGRLVNFVAVKRDVTNEMRLERQVMQSQKMEAVGRLAGGVAHDFNNLLGVITGYGEIVQRRLPHDDPLAPKVAEILKAAERAAGLTRQLLAFSRQQILQPRIVDLNALIEDLAKMLRRLIGEDIQFEAALDHQLGTVKADPGQLEQVLMNLAVNARDAMPEGGRLAIATSNVEVGSVEAALRPPMQSGSYVLLSVTDTGTGMDAETQSHLFEPFYTTKEIGKGTGLGLSTVYGIVKQSDGYIWCESAQGVGTTFRIYLPRADEKPATVRTTSTTLPLKGTETILLIEDAHSLRGVVCEILEGAGYTVLVAEDGRRALQVAEEYTGPIQLIVTDVIMPGLNGRHAAERVRDARPEVEILFISGYTSDVISKHGVLAPGVQFLPKPFSSEDLLHKVRQTLDGH